MTDVVQIHENCCKGQDSGVQATTQVQQAFNPEQPNPIPTETNTSPALHTTHPIYKGQNSGVQATTQVEQAISPEEWMTKESLQDLPETLELVTETEGSDAVDVLKDIRAVCPVKL